MMHKGTRIRQISVLTTEVDCVQSITLNKDTKEKCFKAWK